MAAYHEFNLSSTSEMLTSPTKDFTSYLDTGCKAYMRICAVLCRLELRFIQYGRYLLNALLQRQHTRVMTEAFT